MSDTTSQGKEPLETFSAVAKGCWDHCRPIFCSQDEKKCHVPWEDVIVLEYFINTVEISVRSTSGVLNKSLGRLMEGHDEGAIPYGYAFPVDRQWIDIARLRDRMLQCERDHGKICNLSPRGNSLLRARLSRLIDTELMCIVPATYAMLYPALSYIWGQTQALKLSTSNLNEFQQHGALGLPAYVSSLPRTIKDAISLVKLLDMRYL